MVCSVGVAVTVGVHQREVGPEQVVEDRVVAVVVDRERVGRLESGQQFAVQEQRQCEPLLVLRQQQGLAGVGQHRARADAPGEPGIGNQVVADVVHTANLVDVAQVLLQPVDHQCRSLSFASAIGTTPGLP